jgi:hypothetical protein
MPRQSLFIILAVVIPTSQFSGLHKPISGSLALQALRAEKDTDASSILSSVIVTRRWLLGTAGIAAASPGMGSTYAVAETPTIAPTLPPGITIEVGVEAIPGDKRQYRQIVYASGCRALLVSDPDAAECEVALRVGGNAGQLADPSGNLILARLPFLRND